MPYKTIQQNFANGELNPKMQGRSDVDMYYKSAQKMRDVVTTPYGGFVRRPGSKVIYQGGTGLVSLSGMDASTEITEDETHTIDKVADLDLSTYALVSSTQEEPAGTKAVTVEDSLQGSTITTNYYAWKHADQHFYAWTRGADTVYTTTSSPSSGYTTRGDIIYDGNGVVIEIMVGDGMYDYYRNSGADYEIGISYVYTKTDTPQNATPIYSDTNDTLSGYVANYQNSQIYDGVNWYGKYSALDESKTVVTPASPKTIKMIVVRKISVPQGADPIKLALVGTVAGSTITLSEFTATEEEQSIFVNTDAVFDSVSIVNRENSTISLCVYEMELYYIPDEAATVSTRLIPFVFNNEQAYVISLTYGNVKVFRGNTLVASLQSSKFTNDIIKGLRFAQTADTLIFVHPDLPPTQLVRGSTDNSWTLSDFDLTTIPSYDFEETTPTTAQVTATPDQLDGTVKITLSGTISANLVGQYMEGNGGRVKITSQSGTTLTGYTIIGFYSTDTIASGSWTYTTSYENVWSATRGWPASVTFHGGRLWFGGSKSRPQTVWGSKVGLFNKFDPTSGYDNDAIEFTLDTSELNRITDIYSQKNLLIFTLGGEFVCATSYNEPITPDNVNAIKQTSNGSWDKTHPVDIEGTVMFVERKGQGLMSFAASDNTTDIYNSANSSLINSHLINSPVDIAVERNNLTQQTNYVYIVNEDGTMAVVNLLASQGITGGYTLWKTQGKYRNVCVLPDATYVIAEREEKEGNKFYLERIDFNSLSDGEQEFSLSAQSSLTIPRFAGKKVDIFLNDLFLKTALADSEGGITFESAITGSIIAGLSFRWQVQSNFLEIPQLGVGISRKKRLATMTVRTLDTPELTVNGETQPGGEGIKDIEYYGIGDWDEKPTWTMQEQKPCKVNVMAVQMNVNYQVAGDEY